MVLFPEPGEMLFDVIFSGGWQDEGDKLASFLFI